MALYNKAMSESQVAVEWLFGSRQSSRNAYSKSVFGRGLVKTRLNVNSLVSHIDDLRIVIFMVVVSVFTFELISIFKFVLTSVRVMLNAVTAELLYGMIFQRNFALQNL